MCNRILVVLISCTTLALVLFFDLPVPTIVKHLYFLHFFCIIIIIIITGEPTRTTSKKGNDIVFPSHINYLQINDCQDFHL